MQPLSPWPPVHFETEPEPAEVPLPLESPVQTALEDPAAVLTASLTDTPMEAHPRLYSPQLVCISITVSCRTLAQYWSALGSVLALVSILVGSRLSISRL